MLLGRDPNDEYFPFTYAVVEAETKDSWTWFPNLLLADIGDGRTWVFISDQQKVWFLTIYCLLAELCFYYLLNSYLVLAC